MQITLASIESKLADYQHSCLWGLEKARFEVWQQFQQIFLTRRSSPGNAKVAGRFFVQQAIAGVSKSHHYAPSGAGDLTEALSSSPRNKNIAAQHVGELLDLTLRERIVLLCNGIGWLSGKIAGSASAEDASVTEKLEQQMWSFVVQLEVEGTATGSNALASVADAAADMGGERLLSSISPPQRATADDGGDSSAAVQQDSNSAWGTNDSMQLNIDLELSAQCQATPSIGGEMERHALDHIIGRLLDDGM